MYAPILKKFIERKDTFIERALPVSGNILVKEKDIIKPFDRLGECIYSHKQINYPKSFRPEKFNGKKQFYYASSVLGKLKNETILAPFGADLVKQKDGTYVFVEPEGKYALLSGVWGIVDKVVAGRSVLLKTQTQDLLLAAATPISASGELVVFPNPMEILHKYYLESFSKGNAGKIIYVGHFADQEVVKRAYEMGAVGIIAGSIHHGTLSYAKSIGLALGIISGFGKLETPDQIYKYMSAVSFRYVFLDGEQNVLRIPHSSEEEEAKKPAPKTRKKATALIKEVKTGTDVLVLQSPHFGKIGSVDRVGEFSIFVKFENEKVIPEIRLPNFFIIE